MIEKLKKGDIKEAANVYNKGLRMEVPRGSSTLKETIHVLHKEECRVYKQKGKIVGLVTFTKKGDKLTIGFICAMILRKGIGKKLMARLAKISLRRKIGSILSTVSTKDKRVMGFYKYCGFKKYSQYEAERGFILNRIKAAPQSILSNIS